MSHLQSVVSERCSFTSGDYIDEQWKVDKSLGEGTFGQVFRVKDYNGNIYALKLLKLWEVMASERPNLLKRFEREYETGLITSNYLVHSLQKGMVKGNAYIVMEYCPGGDLQSASKNTKIDLALLAHHVLFGLRDLHINGKVHRDLKPENVLLKDNNHAVLTDFGICGDQNNRLTQRAWTGIPQQRFGTIAYMPPEQINPKRGNATVLPTTDIFSFGVMMYQLLVGHLPFGELKTESDVPQYIQNGKNGIWDRRQLEAIKDGSKWLQLVEMCLKPEFKERLQSVDETLELVPRHDESLFKDSISAPISFKRDVHNGILLRIMQGEELGRIYELNNLFSNNSSVILIGRESADIWNHIKIKENESCYISRQHCTVEKDLTSNNWIIRDGQYRIACPIGLRLQNIFPCKKCSAVCPSKVQWRWKESLNGTYVNSQEVSSEGITLNPGDIISIGDVKMRVEGI